MTMTDQPTWHSAWVSALDDLELTLEETPRLLAGGDVDEVLSRRRPGPLRSSRPRCRPTSSCAPRACWPGSRS